MRILYYILGLSDLRSGGMTMYVDALIKNISKEDEVTILFPGRSSFLNKQQSKIIKYKSRNFTKIQFYELVNPTLIPLMYGVRDPFELLYKCRRKLTLEELNQFYLEVKPDFFHIHTVMGLPLELVSFFKEKGVKLIFTTHDYYGICPKVNLINYKDEYCSNRNEKECTICNQNAKPLYFLKIRNNPFLIENKKIFLKLFSNKKLTKISKRKIQNKEQNVKFENEKEFVKIKKYELYYSYYSELFSLIDIFHFNSHVTESVYKQYFDISICKMIAITHDKINNNRRRRDYDLSDIKIGFIGALSSYKGFSYLYEVLVELKNKGYINWKLIVWGTDSISKTFENVIFKGKYDSNSMDIVFNSMDVLFVPSIWKETFSFVALEALSYGVPVIVSENVGAKSIVSEYGEYVYHSTEGLKQLLINILTDEQFLYLYNANILEKPFEHSMEHHSDIIRQALYAKKW